LAKITVLETEISIIQIDREDYICLTDMLKAKDGDFFVTDWLRNRNTLEYIGIWEQINNPTFNYGEFATIKMTQNGKFPFFPLTSPQNISTFTFMMHNTLNPAKGVCSAGQALHP